METYSIPPEVGRLAVSVRAVGDPNIEWLSFIDCRDALDDTTIKNSSKLDQSLIDNGNLKCIDSSDVSLSYYTDEQGKGSKFLFVEFLPCFLD